MYYMATYPSAVVIFHASDTILRANNDASYLTEPESRSRAAGYFPLESIYSKRARKCLNEPIHVNCNVLIFVFVSSAEAETGRFFMTGRYFIILQKILEEMRQPQPITQVCTDNTTSTGIANNTIKQHR